MAREIRQIAHETAMKWLPDSDFDSGKVIALMAHIELAIEEAMSQTEAIGELRRRCAQALFAGGYARSSYSHDKGCDRGRGCRCTISSMFSALLNEAAAIPIEAAELALSRLSK